MVETVIRIITTAPVVLVPTSLGPPLVVKPQPQEIVAIRKQELTGKQSAADEAKARETAREKALHEKLRASRSREEEERGAIVELKRVVADLSQENTKQRTKNQDLLEKVVELRHAKNELEEKLWAAHFRIRAGPHERHDPQHDEVVWYAVGARVMRAAHERAAPATIASCRAARRLHRPHRRRPPRGLRRSRSARR